MTFVSVIWTGIQFLSVKNLRKINITPFANRTFCSECGSHLSMSYTKDLTYIWVTVSSIDQEEIVAQSGLPRNHIFLAQRAKWFDVPEDGANRYDMFSSSAKLVEND